MILNLMKISIKSLFRNKTRTILTILGIYIGVVSIILIVTFSETIKEKVKIELNDIEELIINSRILNTNKIDYRISKNIITNLEKEKSIKKVAIKMYIECEENRKKILLEDDMDSSENDFLAIYAINKNYFEMYDKLKKNIIFGRNFSSIEENNNLPVCIIKEEFAFELFNKKNCVGEKININNDQFKIIGIIRDDNKTYGSESVEKIYILDSFIQNTNQKYNVGEINYIIEPLSMNSRQDAYTEANKIFSNYLSEEEYILEQYIYSAEDVAVNIINIISIILLIISSISIISGGIGIINVLLVSVNEKVKEIGIRRALGTNKRIIFLQFIIEGIIIMIMAGILGIITSICIIKIGNIALNKYELELYINKKIIINTLLFCGLLGIIFSIYPAHKASKLDPAEALRC